MIKQTWYQSCWYYRPSTSRSRPTMKALGYTCSMSGSSKSEQLILLSCKSFTVDTQCLFDTSLSSKRSSALCFAARTQFLNYVTSINLHRADYLPLLTKSTIISRRRPSLLSKMSLSFEDHVTTNCLRLRPFLRSSYSPDTSLKP